MARLPQVVLVIGAILLIICGSGFAHRLTVRNISTPTPIYQVPYQTHGGTVFISRGEQHALWAGWLTAGALVVAQLIYNRSRRRAGN